MPASVFHRAGKNLTFVAVLCGGACVPISSQTAPEVKPSLEAGFVNPPATARPRVWWHWMNGNITTEGIDLDLEWMHRVGIAGFQNFDAALQTPKVVDKRLIYMTPEWKAAFLHAIKKGDSLGFEMAVAGSPGWSESGGPWVKPEQAMKKVVWSETLIEGGKPFSGTLPPVPSETGPIGNLAQQDPMGAMMGGGAKTADYSKDIAVIAFRNPADEVTMEELKPKVTGNGGSTPDAALLWDYDLNHSASIPVAKSGETAWIQFDFGKPVAIRAMTYVPGGALDPMAVFAREANDGPVLESSDDGVTYTQVVQVPTSRIVQHTLSFAPRTARYFRLAFLEKPAGPPPFDLSELGMPTPPPPTTHEIAELELHTEARVNRFEEKAAYATVNDLYGFATRETASTSVIPKADVVDLTTKMKPDGTLDWTPPSGNWTVLRIGYSLTGITNHPAPPEATGPEVDKLNKADVQAYLDHYLDNYKDATGGLMGKQGLKYVITDSWEAGTQNWTNDMIPEFTKRRGYDPRQWLPVMTGRIVGSAEESDRFLWDVRKTIADLLAENHYGTIAATLHARGMGQYGESHEDGRATIGDGMEMKKADDVPMSAMWTQQPGVNAEQFGYNADIRESASVAHIYGQNLVAAESLTASSNPWGWSPATLKPTADKELAMGLNRFVIHESAHQPLVGPGTAPGLTLGPFGQWFNRNEIWAEQAQPWITYLSRNAWMLQQGRFVADVAYFYGEDSNLTAIFGAKSPDVPKGYNFDYVNADALIHKFKVKDGELTTDSGMRYRVLVLDPYSSHMSLPVLRSIQTLVKDGATVIGEQPVGTPSLADDSAQFKSIVAEMWAGGGSYGKGHIIHGTSVADALKTAAVAKDFSYSEEKPDTSVLFVHRKIGNDDLYYLDNRKDRSESITADFRVEGRAAELWHPDTGKMEDASYTIANGVTSVPLNFDAYETVFVVFRKPTKAASRVLPQTHDAVLAPVAGPWKVEFEAGRGAPAQAELPALASLSENADVGIKYFAGHATYTKTIDASADWFRKGEELWLDLGSVANLAEVKVNGQSLGTVWKAPYRVDVSKAMRPGSNVVEVRVANLWVNRLIGDAQPDAATKYTFTVRNPYKASTKLVPSGLLGPVQIIRKETGAGS